jgi:hypothetical protein
MTSPRPTGRRVRQLNGQIDLALAAAKKEMHLVLGESDPVTYLLAMRKALRELEAAHVASYEIEMICALAARRGRYDKESE